MAENLDLLAGGAGLDITQPAGGLDLLADPNAPGPFKRGLGAGVAGVKSSLYGAGALAARGATAVLPAVAAPITTGLEQAALANAEEQSRIAAEQSMQYEDVVTDPTRAGEFIKWGLGSAVPSLALMLAGGVVGRGLGAIAGRSLAPAAAATARNVGMFTGAVVPDVAVEAGSIYPEALKTGVADPATRALVGGAAAGAVDFLALPPALRALMPAKTALTRAAGFGSMAKTTALEAVKRAPVVGGIEAAQEATQSVIENIAAGKSLSDPAVISDIINSALVGGMAGGAIGGVAGGFHGVTAPVQETPEVGTIAPDLGTPPQESGVSPVQDPAALHAAATQSLAEVEAQTVAAQTAHDALTARRDALTAEAKLPIGERRTKSEIAVERKALAKQIEASKGQVETLGGQLHSARTAVAGLAAQLVPPISSKTDIPPVEGIPAAPTETPEQQTARAVEGARIVAGGNVSPAETNGTESIIPDTSGHAADFTALADAQAAMSLKPVTNAKKEVFVKRALKAFEATVAEVKGLAPEVAQKVAETNSRKLKGIGEEGRQEFVKKVMEATTQRETVTPASDTSIGTNAAGEALYDRADGSRYRMSNGRPDFGGDLAPVGTKFSKGAINEANNSVAGRDIAAANVAGNVATDATIQSRATPVISEGIGRLAEAYRKHRLSQFEVPMAMVDGRARAAIDRVETGIRQRLVAAGISDARVNGMSPVDTALSQIDGHARGELFGGRESNAALTQEGFKAESYYLANKDTDAVVAGPFTTAKEASDAMGGNTQDRVVKGSEIQQSNAALTQDEFDVLPEPAQFAAVDEFNRIMREKGTALRLELARMLGDRPGLIVKTFMATPDSPIGSYTRVGPLKAVISMALNAKDVLGVAHHEGYHAAEDLILTAPEVQIITNALKEGRPIREQLMTRLQQYDRENRTNLTDEVAAIPAEARAYAYEFWKRGELKADGRLQQIWQKLQQFFERVANLVRGLGFKSMEDIFTALDRGQFAERNIHVPGRFGQDGTAWSEMQSKAGEQGWYYSALTKGVAALPTKAASAQGWKDQIKGLIGKNDVKQVELDAVGLNEFLDLQQGKVTKDQVMAFLGENGVRVEETVLGGRAGWSQDDAARISELEQHGHERTDAEDTEYDALITRENAAMTADESGTLDDKMPKFATYQLPGGQNYRELLLRLPPSPVVENPPAAFYNWTPEQQARYRIESPSMSKPGGFRSGHFDQPNILAHIRFNERTDAEGKRVLFIEEIQSDWAQKGKKEGFAKDSAPPEEMARRKQAVADIVQRRQSLEAQGKFAESNALDAEYSRAMDEWNAGNPIRGIPSAPFITKTEAWVRLSLVRMIRYAAENGFDKVAWTTGEQQAERYDLSKQVSSIEWLPVMGTTKQFVGINTQGGMVAIEIEGGKVVTARNDAARQIGLIGKPLDEVVGKEVAKKIEESHKGRLSGEGLKIGGEGMKAFYDKIVPNVANEVLRKLGGGRVEQVEIPQPKWAAEKIKVEMHYGGATNGGGYTLVDSSGMRVTEEMYPSYEAANDVRKALQAFEDKKMEVPKQSGFTITPELARRAAEGIPLFSRAGIDPLIPAKLRTLYSKAAVIAEQQIRTQMEAGELERMQTQASFLAIHDNAQIPGPSFEFVTGLAKAEANGFKRWWFTNIATPNFVSKSSLGYKNVMNTLNTYIRFRKILAEQMLREKLPSWYKAPDVDRKAAFGVMLKRTVEGYSKDSTELTALLAALTPEQKTLYTQATGMIEGFLRAQFIKDQAARKTQLTSPGAYEKWEADRKAQVDSMIDKGYVPLRRYGDYSVRVYTETPDGKRVDGGLVFVDSERASLTVAKMYQDEIDRTGVNLKVEQGTRDKNVRDTGISIEQFLGTLRRNGVDISQAERERLVLTFTNSESMIRNKLMHREGLPGYSEDSMRVLHEFGVNTSGELAYARFANAIDAASEGRAVTADVNSVNSEPEIKVDERLPNEDGTGYEPIQDFKARNLWTQDGQQSGFYKNISNELSNYVLVPDHSGGWSRRLRAGAMVYFIGGSLSGAVVNAMSIPMLTVPELSIHTGYGNALTTTMGAWKDAWRYYHILRDTDKLVDPSVVIPGISMELRQAIRAASDHIFDTEIHQMLGMSQGTVYSKSRKVQRAMEVWMAPFRVSEQTNRLTSFMAAYRIGQENKLTGQELFKFASGIVDSTQNNYNESNRPGAARNPIFALMFMFKSFPLFMTEAIALMYKQSPKSAVYMLLGLTMLTGVQGLPFAETIQDLIDTIAQQIFGSAFNSRRAMRNVIKSASEAMVGADLSEIVLRGVINDVLGVSVSSRIGAGDFVPGSRLGTADADKGRVLSDMLGAPFAMVKDAITNVGKGVGGTVTGDWKQTADALRAGGPVAIRNAIKGAEQLNTGFAWDSKGRKVADVNTLSAVLQLGGLSSAGVAKAYELESINIQTKAFYQQVSADMQNHLVKAIKDNDQEKVQEINDLRVKWNAEYPTMPIMPNAAAVRRGIILAGVPLDQRSRMLWSRRIRGENVFSEQQ